MATGISAAPIELVMFHPNKNEVKAAFNKIKDPSPTLSVAIKATRPATFKAAKGLLRYLFIGKSNVNLMAASLINAAIEPVNVMPPINVPKKAAILCIVEWSTSSQYEANEVVTAARPTKAWKPATVCGSSVTATLLPKTNPAAPPRPNKNNACVKRGPAKFNEHKAVITPVEIPMRPRALPTRDVDCEAKPEIPPMQQSAAAK